MNTYTFEYMSHAMNEVLTAKLKSATFAGALKSYRELPDAVQLLKVFENNTLIYSTGSGLAV